MSDRPSPTLPLTVTLTVQQWQALLTLLGEAPYKVSGPLIADIENQAQPQLVAAAGRSNGTNKNTATDRE